MLEEHFKEVIKREELLIQSAKEREQKLLNSLNFLKLKTQTKQCQL